MRPLRRRGARRGALAAPALLVAGLLAGCGSEADGDDPASGSGEQAASAAGFPEGTDTGAECDYPEDPRGPAAREVDAPPGQARYDGTVQAVIELGQGELVAELDAASAPCTVGSFVSLAQQDYFDGTPCHRLTTSGIFVLQCGDPSGTGTGGPGYTYADELSGSETYPAGTVAMANAGPDTNGSQFFLVYQDTQLPPAYTVLGALDDGSLEIVQDIAAEGVEGGGPDGPPATEVVVEDVHGTG